MSPSSAVGLALPSFFVSRVRADSCTHAHTRAKRKKQGEPHSEKCYFSLSIGQIVKDRQFRPRTSALLTTGHNIWPHS